MKILIITSCTGEKRHSPNNQLTQKDFLQLHDTEVFESLEYDLTEYRTQAEGIYTGQQHLRLLDGISAFRGHSNRSSVELWILSAGYGLIPGNREIVPYECTFQGMKVSEIDTWADHLNIPDNARNLFSQLADLVLVLLGDGYLRSLKLDENVEFATPTFFFASKNSKRYIKGKGQIRIVTLSNIDAKRFSCGLVGLKGELAKRLLQYLSVKPAAKIPSLFDSETDVLSLLDNGITSDMVKSKTKPKRAQPNPKVDHVIDIPSDWWQKPHRAKLRYFIPEWDDLVDPDYDFETDTHSGGQGDWSNEIYAHQMYPEPNYDGILVSKVVAEKSKKKRERINRLGVHRYLRVPQEYPIMGDCGAFGYIKEVVPPYTTGEILDYYSRLGFDLGVSIDHLIVKATEEQKQTRYDLTIHNAEEFLREHHQRGLEWTPVGAVQGWDPRSYADAARQYVAMGYKYIGLGGLVRTSTKGILEILHEVHQVVPETVSIHLFGIARLAQMSTFASLGVRSIDSASHLRRAWLGSKDNYWTLDGERYAAIRIPEAGKSFRAKRIVDEERASAKEVATLERASIKAVRKFDRGNLSVDQTLDILDQFDHLITPDRSSMRIQYERTLEAQPWKVCPCDICQRDGVETVIFRGNNRNRRRGFHNTFVFYQLLQQAILDETDKTATFQLPLI